LRDFQGQRVDRDRPAKFVHKTAPAIAVGFGLGAIDAVRQLHDSDSGESALGLSLRGSSAFQNVPDALPQALACDEQTGIEDQSHAGGLSGLRWLSIISLR